MADDNSGLMAEFEEFLNAKRERETQDAADEDYDVEIWDEKGRGARVKRSHAKPFLQSLGIDMDPAPEPAEGDNGDGKKSKSNRTSTGSPSAASSTVARKYFTKKSLNGRTSERAGYL